MASQLVQLARLMHLLFKGTYETDGQQQTNINYLEDDQGRKTTMHHMQIKKCFKICQIKLGQDSLVS